MTLISLVVSGIRGYALRFALTVLAVMLGVAFVAGTSVLGESMRTAFTSIVGGANQGIDAFARGPVAGESAGVSTYRSIDADAVTDIRGVASVKSAWPQIDAKTIAVKDDGTAMAGVIAMAGNPDDVTIKVTDGALPTSKDTVALDAKMASALGKKPGDTIDFVVADKRTSFTVSALVTIGAGVNANVALFQPDYALEAFTRENRVTAIAITAKDGVTQRQLISDVAGVLTGKQTIVTGSGKMKEDEKAVGNVVNLVRNFLLVFAAVALVVGAFIIVNTFTMVIAQRTTELAVLRAVGASGGQILRLVVAEALVVGIVGGVFGLAAGVALAMGVQWIISLRGMATQGVDVTWTTIVLALSIGLIVTGLAAVVPALKAAKVRPIEAMRSASSAAQAKYLARTVIGVLIAAAGVGLAPMALDAVGQQRYWLLGASAMAIIIGTLLAVPGLVKTVLAAMSWPMRLFGMVPSLARGNTLRDPRRTAATASALTIGVTLVSAVSVVSASATASVQDILESGVKSDLVVSAATGTIDPDIAKKLENLDDAASVASFRGSAVLLNKAPAIVMSAETDALQQAMRIDMVDGTIDTLTAGKILVSKSAAADNEWTVGTELPATSFDGKDRTLSVGGIYDDNPALSNAVLAGPTLTKELSPPDRQRPLMVLLTASSPDRVDSLKDAATETVSGAGVYKVQTRDEFSSEKSAGIRNTLQIVSSLLLLSVVIASLGIMNTLIMAVHERTSEIGMLRAVGLSRGELSRMITLEAILVATFGAAVGGALGVGIGTLAQKCFADKGIGELAIPWGELSAMLVGAALLGVLAAILPALRAGKINIVDAIA